MPEIGQIKTGKELGRKKRSAYQKFIWHACIDCGAQRWTITRNGKAWKERCQPCGRIKAGSKYSQANHPSWKGGRRIDQYGYVNIKLQRDDFFFPMVRSNGYVYEHRLVVAKALGRNLLRWEIVHHKNGDKQDNRYPENLQLVTDDRHKQITILERRIDWLEGEAENQDKQIKLLKWQIKSQMDEIRLNKKEEK